jgi:cytoskeletal protein RodZ
MGELGRLLQETREDKGLTLEEVEQQTRIRGKFLAALEEGNYDELPTSGHVHGFLRNYTLYLGLDWDEVRALYDEETSSHRLFEPGIFHPKDIALAPRRPLVRASLVLASVVIVVVLVIGGWAFWRYGWSFVQPMLPPGSPWGALPLSPAEPPATSTSGAQSRLSTATRDPSSTPLRRRSATATRTSIPTKRVMPTETTAAPTVTPTATREQPVLLPTPTPRPTQTPTPTQEEGVVLEIKVIERSWLQVTVDDEELPGELLESDEERRWEAQGAIYYICGNAGGVEVAVNGEELGTLGERGEVVERTWTVEGEVTPTPPPEGSQASQTLTATPASASP